MTAAEPAGGGAGGLQVDSHAHVFDPSLPLAGDRRYTPEKAATLEDYLATLDGNGIAYAVLTAPSFLGTDNTQLLDTLARAEGRLRGTAIVAPGTARSELERMAAGGIVGIRFNLFERQGLPDLGAPEYQRLLGEVAALGWHVELYAESPKLLHLLPPLRAAGVTTVVDHFGSPDAAAGLACPGFQALLEALALGRTWVKLSAPFRLQDVDLRACAQALIAAGGTRRLVWGSDWPWVRYEGQSLVYGRLLAELAEWVPDGAARARILGANALELFGFPSASPS